MRRHVSYCTQLWQKDDTSLWVTISHPAGLMTPWFVAVAYLPPQGSNKLKQIGVSQRLDTLAEIAAAAAELGHVLVAGDFNARVAHAPESLVNLGDGIPLARGFTDAAINSHGRDLLRFCQQTGLLLCSGRVNGDLTATPTFKARQNTQPSRLDHVLTTPDTFPLIQSSSVNAAQCGSDHWPIETECQVDFRASPAADAAHSGTPLPQARWQSRTQQEYASALDMDDALQKVVSCAADGQLDAASEAIFKALDSAAAASQMQAGASCKNTQTRLQRLFKDAKVDELKGTVRQIQKVQPHSDELKQAEAEYHRETRRVKCTLEMKNFTAMSKQIRTDPHSVYATLKGRPKRLPLHLQNTFAWNGYVTKLAAGVPQLQHEVCSTRMQYLTIHQ